MAWSPQVWLVIHAKISRMSSRINSLDVALFALRRAWLVGLCRRIDIERAWGVGDSPTLANRLVAESALAWRSHLRRVPYKGLYPLLQERRPKEVSAGTMLALFARGASARETGLFPEEATVLLPDQPPVGAMTELATEALLDALIHGRPVRVLYVGLREGERARWRVLCPQALEFTGSPQCRLHAQDLEVDGAPSKTFVLARIFEVQPADKRFEGFSPALLPATVAYRAKQRLRLTLNEDLTPDQKQAIAHELGIKGGIAEMPEQAVHNFGRIYANAAPTPGIVWPPIARIEHEAGSIK